MEKDSAKEEERIQNGKQFRINNVIQYIALLIAPIALFFLEAGIFLYDLKKDKKEEEMVKLASQPQLEAEWGEKVPIGMEDYWRIDLMNKNENNITSGIFTIQYMVLLRTEVGVDEPVKWEDVFMESEIAYDDDLQGCFLLIKDDFLQYEDSVMDKCVDHGIEVTECGSYAFCGFQYVEEGQEKTVYYLISLKLYEKCKVTEVKDPEKYVEGYLMDS